MDNNDFVPDYLQSVYEEVPGPKEFQKGRVDEATQAQEFAHLCYDVFQVHPDGKRLYEKLVEDILVKSGVDMSKPQAKEAAIYLEGMRNVIRTLRMQIESHRARIAKG